MSKNLFLLLLILLILSPVDLKKKKKKKKSKKRNTKQTELKKEAIYLEVIPEADYDDYLENFHLDMIHTIAVNPKDQMEYNATFNFDKEPEKAFYWISFIVKDDADVEFVILDREDNSYIYTAKKQTQFLAKVSFKSTQTIKFIFRNLAYNTFARVTVGLSCQDCDSGDLHAIQDDVNNTLEKVKDIQYMKSKMEFISEIYTEKQKRFLKNIQKSHNKLFYFSLAEVAAMIVINMVQVFVIKNLISNKRLV